MIKYQLAGTTYFVETMKFPGGEVGVRLPSSEYIKGDIKLTAHLKSSDGVMELLLTVDALRRNHPGSKIHATIPYIPYARQDRVCNPGESLSIAVMASLINSCNFETVTTLDPHSDVVGALINNLEIIEQYDVFRFVKTSWANTHIVAPDGGAYKKCMKFAQRVGAAGVIVCNKVRNLKTGQIESLTCSENVEGKELFVLDDICDGGRTFIELAQELKGAKSISLAVTHGIFSKGVDVVAKHYDAVYTTNSFHGNDLPKDWDGVFQVNY